VRVETQVVFTNLLTNKVSQIPLASNTSLMTSISHNARLLINARIAHGHHAQLDKLAKTNVGLLTTNTTMSATTTRSMVFHLLPRLTT
jgi:hypothetical protein